MKTDADLSFPSPLVSGTLIQRYKRFMADVQLEDGRVVTAHVANSGAMLGVKEPGLKVWLSVHTSSTRKFPHSWELVEVDDTLVGVNTRHPNALIQLALNARRIAPLSAYTKVQAEATYDAHTRFDFLLTDPEGVLPPCYVEVKNVHLNRGTCAVFPDAVTARGAKHLTKLVEVLERNHRAVVIYVIQRGDMSRMGIASDIDPVYAKASERFVNNGGEIYAYPCLMALNGISLMPNSLDCTEIMRKEEKHGY